MGAGEIEVGDQEEPDAAAEPGEDAPPADATNSRGRKTR
jgi:hypothetical protein